MEEPIYLDEYLTMKKSLNHRVIIKSLRRLRKELPKLNHSNVHMYMWFTNLPTMDDEAHLPLIEMSAAGFTGSARNPVICTRKKVALIRGPSRLDQNTAGVGTAKYGLCTGETLNYLLVLLAIF